MGSEQPDFGQESKSCQLCHLVTARTSERVAALKSVKPLRECWPDISPVEEKNNRDPRYLLPSTQGHGEEPGNYLVINVSDLVKLCGG